MSADLEVLLNDLIMQSEHTNAEFRHELANAHRIKNALNRMRQLNAMAFNEALTLMQELPQPGIETQPMPQFLNRALAN